MLEIIIQSLSITGEIVKRRNFYLVLWFLRMCAGFMGVELSEIFLRMLLDAFLRWDAGTTVLPII
jgi:hypothetical protein